MRKILSFILGVCIFMSTFLSNMVYAASGSDIVAEARKWIGTPYGDSNGSGGYGTKVDCSGLTLQVYAKFGVSLPWYANSQRNYGTPIGYSSLKSSNDYSALQLGDLVFFDYGGDGIADHVAIYSGSGNLIHALNSGVKEAPLTWTTGVYSGQRFYNAVCDVKRLLNNANTQPPTDVGMICNYENMTVKPGTAIQLSYWGTNVTEFDIDIYKDEVIYKKFTNVSNPFYFVPSEGGVYSAVGYARNNIGSTLANKRAFKVTECTPPIIPDGTYSILSAIDESYALNVYARDTSDNNTIIIWQDPSQKFDVKYLGGGLYKITSAVTGKVLDAKEAQRVDGTDLVQYTWNEWIGQKWRIERSEDGYFYIINCYNGLCIDVTGGSANNGTNVQLFSKHNTTNQKWLFSPITHNVTFDANGGTSPIVNKNIIYKSVYGTLPIPTRNGFKFKGWYTDKIDGSEITSETIVNTTSDITLYAQWEFVIPYTESIVTKSNSKIVIDTEVNNLTVPYNILIAGYKNNVAVAMKIMKHSEQEFPYTFKEDIDEIKVMVWDGLSTLTPLCEAEVIPSSEFIVE